MPILAYTFDPTLAGGYVDLCQRLYRDDPNWTPPPAARLLRQFSPELPFYRQPGNTHRHFLAAAGTTPVGHASAFVNAGLRDEDGTPVGAIGFFECVETPEVGAELLAHARAWLREEHGLERVWAPMQFDIWRGYRLMTRGFQVPTFFGEPYNRPYYPALLERNGFGVRKRWHSVEIRGLRALQRLLEPAEPARELAEADGYRLVPLEVRSPAVVAALQAAVEGSYRHFLGVTRLEPGEFQEVFALYAGGVDPRLAIAAQRPDGVLAGFAIAYPDPPRAAPAAADRWPFPAQAERAVFFMIGITPEESARRRGVGHALFAGCLRAILEAGFAAVVFALLADDSPGWALLGSPRPPAQKEYALYEARLER
jgi:hypothetical protein